MATEALFIISVKFKRKGLYGVQSAGERGWPITGEKSINLQRILELPVVPSGDQPERGGVAGVGDIRIVRESLRDIELEQFSIRTGKNFADTLCKVRIGIAKPV